MNQKVALIMVAATLAIVAMIAATTVIPEQDAQAPGSRPSGSISGFGASAPVSSNMTSASNQTMSNATK